MSLTFDDMLGELGLPLVYEKEEHLTLLQSWCELHISRDVHVLGHPKDRYTDFLALAKDYLDVFAPHLDKPLDERVPALGGRSVFQYAVEHGFDYFIESKRGLTDALLHTPLSNEMTPLHIAAAYGYPRIVKALLDAGASLHKKNTQQQTPLFSALFVPMLSDASLIDAKIDIFNQMAARLPPDDWLVQDKYQESLLHLMVARSGFDGLVAEVLVRAPGLVKVANHASRYPIHTAILNRNERAVELLLTQPDVTTLADEKGQVPLHYAARYQRPKILERCFVADPSLLDKKDDRGSTPLMLAAQNNNEEAVKYLIAQGARMDCVDMQGLSLLHWAVKYNNLELTKWLLDHGGDVLASNRDDLGLHALFYAEESGNDAIIALLQRITPSSGPAK